ncbi:MAG: RodZ domain-containing protein [Candidatus Thermochlorobacter sp.]
MQNYDIASELAAARQAMGIALLDISRQTNIQLEFLQRLESGCYDFLPPFYVRQIVRKYAEALNLPAETLCDYLKALDELFSAQSHALQAQQVPPSSPSSDERLERLALLFSPMRLAIFGLSLLALAAGAFYFSLRSSEPEVIRRIGTSGASVMASASEPPASPLSAQPASTSPAPLPPTLDAVSTTPAAASGPISTFTPEHSSKKKLSLVVRAKSDCWVGVVADEHKVQEAYLRANESSHFDADSLVKLTLGKAEVAEVWLNGKSVDLPKRAGVVSNLRFSLKDIADQN